MAGNNISDRPLAFVNAARSYHLAALNLHDNGADGAFPDLPLRQCLVIALELYLKGWLLEDGLTIKEVSRLKHNIQAAGKAAIERGFEIGFSDRHLLSLISTENTLIEDRYLNPGETRQVPNRQPMFSLADNFYCECFNKLKVNRPDYEYKWDVIRPPFDIRTT